MKTLEVIQKSDRYEKQTVQSMRELCFSRGNQFPQEKVQYIFQDERHFLRRNSSLKPEQWARLSLFRTARLNLCDRRQSKKRTGHFLPGWMLWHSPTSSPEINFKSFPGHLKKSGLIEKFRQSFPKDVLSNSHYRIEFNSRHTVHFLGCIFHAVFDPGSTFEHILTIYSRQPQTVDQTRSHVT